MVRCEIAKLYKPIAKMSIKNNDKLMQNMRLIICVNYLKYASHELEDISVVLELLASTISNTHADNLGTDTV